MFERNKAQSTLEYALIIAVVIAALLAINTYMKRGVQGRLKESTDEIGKQFDASQGYTSAWKATSSGATTTTETRASGTGTTTSAVTGGETVTKSQTEEWGSAPGQRY